MPPPQPANPALEASPVVFGGDNGVEVQYWVAHGGPGAMWGAFSEFRETAVPVEAETVRILRENGLRLMAVPVDRLSEVQTRLSIIGAVQRQWLGQVPAWVDVAAGPQHGAQTIALHDGPLRLGPGRLRMLLRAWTLPEPVADDGARGAALHLELVPQHQEARQETSFGPLRSEARAPEQEGIMFERMAVTARLRGDVALVMVPETPGLEWQEAPPEPAPSPPAAPSSAGIGRVTRVDPAAPAPAPAAPANPPAPTETGPPARTLPSLGEAMLMSRGDSRTMRAVVVLLPRVPDRFELLGR